MLKGAQKKMYVVKLGQDSLFEEAYFVLKRDSTTAAGKDMVSEANKIIRQSTGQDCAKKATVKLGWQAALSFLCGLLVGGGITLALCLLL